MKQYKHTHSGEQAVQSMNKRNGLSVYGKTCLQLSKNKYHFSVSYRKLWKWFLYICLDTYLMRV